MIEMWCYQQTHLKKNMKRSEIIEIRSGRDFSGCHLCFANEEIEVEEGESGVSKTPQNCGGRNTA